MGESQSRSVMLHHQDQHLDSVHSGTTRTRTRTTSSLQNKDPNFNFVLGEQERVYRRGGDQNHNQNHNQVCSRTLALGRDPPSPTSSGFHHGSGVSSPRSRLPCWSPLEPLPEVESGEDGRVPPEGAEEQGGEEEEGGAVMMMMMMSKHRQDEDEEWGGDSESGSELGPSMSSLNEDSEGAEPLMRGWGRVGVGEPRPSQEEVEPTLQERNRDNQQSSDSEAEPQELVDPVWTLRERERFKAQEMEKHQVQLTMYRRLALIRWVRTLQGQVQEQQNRLQSSFDVILTHRKELLRMGAAAAAVSQS